jgi:C4-dicarboxylate transporter DctM subunit
MAGLLPGILLFVIFSITVIILCKISGKYTPMPKASFPERMKNLKKAFWGLLMPIIILGGIYTGFFTPTESAAVAVVYGLVYMIWARRKVDLGLFEIMKDSTKTVAMICIMMSSALALGKIIAMLQVPQKLMAGIVAIQLPGWLFIMLVMMALIIFGMFLSAMEITLLTMPILTPVLQNMEFDLVWFAVLFTVNMELGLITPPFGLNLFVVQQITDTPLSTIVRGVWPFALGIVLLLILVAFFPALSLWLPSTMR